MSNAYKSFVAGAAALLVGAALMPPAVAASGLGESALAAPAAQLTSGLAEPRWLPWLGCWELVADTIDDQEVESTGRRVVCVAPRPDGLGVALTTHIDGVVVAENTVIANEQERPLQDEGCSGSQSAGWSADGRRISSHADTSCTAGGSRTVSSLSMLVEPGLWLELESVSLDDGAHREMVVRRYRRTDEATVQELGFALLDAATAARAASARAAASAALDIDDVLEIAATLPSEMAEAAIVESGATFDLDRDALFRLADAGVDDSLIDLMVAVSFPEQFVVDTGNEGGGGGIARGYWYAYPRYPYYVSCSGPYYYRSMYAAYSSVCDPWFAPWGLGYRGYYRPYVPYRVSVKVPATGSLYGGRVMNGRGYARVRNRNDNGANGGSGVLSKLFGSSIGNSVGSTSSGSSSASGKAGSVSPGGYSQGGSSSSSGSSSGGGTAKPRGGGGGAAKPVGGGGG